MRRRKLVLSAVVLGAMAVLGIGFAVAQEAGPGARGARGRFDPAQMRQRNMDRIKESLGATDEEWVVLQPRIEKVSTLSREAGGFGGGRMFRGARQGGGRTEGGEQPQPQTPVAKATQDLQTTLENKDAKPAEIKAKLTALREAREKAKQDLAKARQQLRDLVSVRQEAQLVLMGMLD